MNRRAPETEADPTSPDPSKNSLPAPGITMIGAGYVGLVTGTCLAKLGFDVLCLDTNANRVAALKAGRSPIYEPGLEALMERQVAEGRLRFDTFEPKGVAHADFVFLAVGTPSLPGSDQADLSQIFEATRMVAPQLRAGACLVVKSTVPAGTNSTIRAIVAERRPGLAFSVVSNPEFLREGRAVADFLRPDRIVVGCHDDAGRAGMERIYRSFVDQDVPVLFTSPENAELIKYAANAFLAMKVAFANEVSDLCEAAGGDVRDVVRGIGLDARIGPRFLEPGPGFGGSCFPKDTRAFVDIGRRLGRPQRLVEAVVAINEDRKESLSSRVADALGSCAGKTIAVLGVAFKPDTDDLREAPALRLIPALVEAGAEVRFYDPQVAAAGVAELEGALQASTLAAALEGADAAVLLTEWAEFRMLDLVSARRSMRGATFVDFRNLYARDTMGKAGFLYHPIGSAPLRDLPLLPEGIAASRRVSRAVRDGRVAMG
ncbi:UDP-glucose dehydrogenase family protein [Aurantimonas endophytica]|uniref:UDP-glucose 6-dehydrogenase n=2 Tax=Aurantimonas endophytica TaxID=1522175 RepID=A0A7W6MR88_9HYPH|nr:UDP-glucose/GDP-mannose dehydrogenase family protein [Aurantimonas endophytica]MBB4004713.1 UDPglucose 6-dehydrogenase [Aurantimonas endophytica]MCO6405529.1 nucleotide sugar dehydrogenase [Aurantimonas endophytica]